MNIGDSDTYHFLLIIHPPGSWTDCAQVSWEEVIKSSPQGPSSSCVPSTSVQTQENSEVPAWGALSDPLQSAFLYFQPEQPSDAGAGDSSGAECHLQASTMISGVWSSQIEYKYEEL